MESKTHIPPESEPLALGPHIGPDTNRLVSKKPRGPNANPEICVTSLFCVILPALCSTRAGGYSFRWARLRWVANANMVSSVICT